MFGPHDLCTVREVWESLGGFAWDARGYTSSTPAFEFDGLSLFEDTSDLCWTFLRGAKTATIVMPTGKHEPAKPQLFDCYNTDQDVGVHLSLKLGTVGSGNPFFTHGANVDLDALYGASRRCMVYVSKRELEAFLSELEKREKIPKPYLEPLSDQIISYHKAHPLAVRADITAALIGSNSGRAFDRHWRKAASKEKTLSDGGRRKKVNPDK